MFSGTAGKVLAALEPYKLKRDGQNQYRANSPFRIGSNSHAFTLVIDDDGVIRNVAQGGACFAVWFKTKDAKIKAITLPSAFSAMLGITEAAIFGINLRFVKPFIAALVGGAAGGAWVVSMHVYMTAVGLTAIPGMAIVQASSLLNYIIGMAIAFAVAFALSLTLKYKTDAE